MLHVLSLFLLVNLSLASDVLEFSDSNFNQKILQHSIILVEFYAPWCGHCKRLAPEYEEAATKLKKSDPPISIAKVDCIAETKTCEKYGVSGYPTLKVFKNGQFSYEYGGERTADGIVKYMNGKSGPVSREISNIDDIAKFSYSISAAVFGHFKTDGSDLHVTFQSVADKLNEDISFGHTFNEDIASDMGLKEGIYILYPKLMASKFEDTKIRFEGGETANNIIKWIETNIMGVAGLRTPSNMKFFEAKPLVTAYYNADYEKNPKGSNYWRNRILKVGKKFLDFKVHFAISNSMEHSQELSEYGIESPDPSKVYITIRDSDNKKFVMKEEFSMDALEKFLQDFVDDRLIAFMKSEEVPTDSSGPVRVVVAKNFDEVVNDPTKDVLIEFYAPWCGHCKSLAPKYEEVAEKLAGETNIVIAKMDATANDVPAGYEVTGFPTLYWAPRGQKAAPVPYNGEREVADLIKFVAAQATSPLKGFDRRGKSSRSEL